MSQPFSIVSAITAGMYARDAYGETPLGSMNVEWITGTQNVDVTVLVIHEADRVTFSFEGTHDVRGWFRDGSILFHRYTLPDGTVIGIHSGFYGTVDNVFNRIVEIARAAIAAGKKVFVTGHSKGAGECLILAGRLFWECAITVQPVYCFGCPRVFDQAAQVAFEKIGLTVWRVVNANDVVCRLPSLFGYHHVGQVAFFDSEGELSENPKLFFRAASDFFGAVWGLVHRKNVLVYDHGASLYIIDMLNWQARYQADAA